MAKLLKLRRGTTSQHSSFTGAEGEVTVDTDKETLVVHDGSTAGGHPVAAEDLANVSSSTIAGRLNNDSLATSKIAAGALPTDVTIATANINDDAVSYAKIQNVSATDRILGRDSSGAGVIEEITPANVRTMINVEDGATADQSASEILTAVKTVDGAGSGLDADVLDGQHGSYYQNASNLNAGTVPDARLPGTISSDITGTAAVASAVTITGTNSNVTLYPLFTTGTGNQTVYNDAGGGLAFNASSNTLTAGTFSGNGSGLTSVDATTLDSIDSGSFIRSDADDTVTGVYNFHSTSSYPVVIGNTSGASDAHLLLRGSNDPYIMWREGNTDRAYIQWNSSGDYIAIINNQTAEELRVASGSNGLVFREGGNNRVVWHQGNDGSGSGLDADTLDGVQAGGFLRADAADTATSDITFSGGAGAVTVSGGSDIRIAGGSWTGEYTGLKLQANATDVYFQYQGSTYFRTPGASNKLTLDSSGNLTASGNVTAYSDARLKTDIHTINDALSICGKLRGVSFKWLETNKPSIGVIAQEVEEVIPEVVVTKLDPDPVTGEETEIKSVDYGKIVGVLINAINELKAEVDELKGGK